MESNHPLCVSPTWPIRRRAPHGPAAQLLPPRKGIGNPLFLEEAPYLQVCLGYLSFAYLWLATFNMKCIARLIEEGGSILCKGVSARDHSWFEGDNTPECKFDEGEAYLIRVGAFGMFGHTATWRIYDLRKGVVREGTMSVDHALKLQGQFEGILGLGRPDFKATPDGSSQEESMVHVPGFFDRAHVQRFSMCFNRNADGVLGINTPPHPNALSSVGPGARPGDQTLSVSIDTPSKLHWGLDFQGISIGDQKMQVSFCDPKSKEAGMETACGIIPDSGTTLIAGPEMQLGMLFEAVCNGWQRCKDTQAKLQEELQDLRKRGMAVDQGRVMANVEKSTSLLVFSVVVKHRDVVAMCVEEPTEFLDLVERVIRPEGLGVGIQEERGPPEAGIKTLEHPGLPMRSTRRGGQMLGDQAKVEAGALPFQQIVDGSDFEMPPSVTLQLLLEHCADWIENVDLDTEMPQLNFHVAGANGNKETLVMKPTNYILARDMEVDVPAVANVLGIPIKLSKAERKKVCMMGFSPIEYKTEQNGDVWILGTPLFYEYIAHYNRGTGPEEEVSMGFTKRDHQECGRCEGNEIILPSESLISENGRSDGPAP
eukprot:g18222.t1